MTPKPTDPVHVVLTEDQIAKLLYVLKLDNLLDPTDVIIITNRLRIRKDVVQPVAIKSIKRAG
jgi:hypothetical protein